MSSNPATLSDDPSTPIRAAGIIPWLLSASAHCLLLIILAVGFVLSRGPAPPVGSPTGVSLNAAIVASDVQGPYSDEPTGDPQGGETVGGSGGAGNGSGADPSATEPGLTTGGAGGGPLNDVLQSAPPIDFAGSLPAVTPGLGGSALEGGGVGTAQTTTSGSAGSKNLRGGYARTGVFGIENEGYKFIYVFDRSGSMGDKGGTPLAAAKGQLIDSLERLGQTHQFQIIFYNQDPHVFNLTGSPNRLVFATDQNKALAARFVGSVTADGGTAHEEALLKALAMSPDVIFFLTDADEPRLSATQLARIVKANKGSVINTIEFGYGPAYDSDNFLIRLARQNRGRHVYVDISQLPRPE